MKTQFLEKRYAVFAISVISIAQPCADLSFKCTLLLCNPSQSEGVLVSAASVFALGFG